MAERRAAVTTAAEPNFLQFNDLACEAVGGKVIFATDEWFAPAANLLKREPPQFIPSAFTEFGKWMDGWETRRKRTTDKPPTFSLDGDRTGMAASDIQLAAVAKLGSEVWPELVCVSELKPGYSDCCHNHFKVNFNHRVTHLRLNMHPDGGIARLRAYGVGQRDWSSVSSHQYVDLVALTNGGVCLGYSDAHFGHPRNMIGLGQAVNMADGWETARRLDRPKHLKVDQRGILQVPGSEWAVFRLGHPGVISSVEVDTNHFKGNFPDSCRIEVCSLTAEEEAQCIRSRWNSGKWRVLLSPQKLHPHHRHLYNQSKLTLSSPVTHVRLIISPDGGVSRLRLWGRPTANQNIPASKL
ncbi:allantoicase isoform X5 [Epinephelus fuscoguttatus]|uniref:allantoicase isoform X5 n=1 Tax=Epinephelus fuscoguttatus TaxID=293821 RepID=UPI0020D139C7|nr:allantoicase isoform X5 [Epinephelus fuscoguttatus]